MVGGIAHSFNNMLMGILGNISLAILMSERGQDNARALTEAKKAAIKARDLTRRLLDISKSGSTKRAAGSLSPIILDAVEFALKESKCRPKIRFDENLWMVEMNQVQIAQAFRSLIASSVQSMPNGGAITIRAQNRELGKDELPPHKAGKYLQVSIKDRGGAAEPGDSGRASDSNAAGRKKRGPGLTASYSIIKNHGGFITVDSETSTGGTVHVFLPACDKPAWPQSDEKVVQRGNGRILVMEDDRLVRELLETMLDKIGYATVVTSHGEDTIKEYKNAMDAGRPFDAVILDLAIKGGMGGTKTIRRLKEIDPRVKAILSSGYSTDEAMSNYRKYGFSGLVAKPYELKELSRILMSVLQARG